MKTRHVFLSIAALIALGLAHAERPELGASPKIDESRSSPASDANRVSSSSLAASTKSRGRPTTGPGAAPAAAPVFVDSTGKVVGRAIGDDMALTTYEGQPLKIMGLDETRFTHCVTYEGCQSDGDGSTWTSTVSVRYTSRDCTGPAYVYPMTQGVYAAFPIYDDGVPYLYIHRPGQATMMRVQSYFNRGRCFNYSEIDPLSPVLAVVPAANYGTPPFFIK